MGGYRADIDGLRGLAVIAVILFHYLPSVLPAGFYGVDVFLVISGFVITRQLAVEHGRTGRISLLDFYVRRARRLLPALLLMLSVGAVAAHLLLVPPGLDSYARKMVYGLAFAINVNAAGEMNYFVADAQTRRRCRCCTSGRWGWRNNFIWWRR